jgi:hypothetical protein
MLTRTLYSLAVSPTGLNERRQRISLAMHKSVAPALMKVGQLCSHTAHLKLKMQHRSHQTWITKY